MIPLGVTAAQSLQGAPAPADIPTTGLLYWLEADFGVFTGDGTVPAVDNDRVRLWTNRGSAGDVSQVTEDAQPVFFADDFDSGMPSVSLGTGVSEIQHFSDLAFSQPSGNAYNPWTLFLVCGVPGGLVPRAPLLGSDVANGKMDLYRWGFGSPNPDPMVVAGIPMNEGDTVWIQNGCWCFRAEEADAAVTANVHVNMRLDGVELVDVTAVPGSTAAVTAVKFGLDNGSPAAGAYGNQIYAFLFYDRVLSPEEVAVVEAYLMGKYVFSVDPEA